ncbi:MAG: hypothetical protein D6753_03550 [Planctomycetota bacterium]|nr:MAG: hypothetical protein D6753_03550 [Planctomycetota bacterium]
MLQSDATEYANEQQSVFFPNGAGAIRVMARYRVLFSVLSSLVPGIVLPIGFGTGRPGVGQPECVSDKLAVNDPNDVLL